MTTTIHQLRRGQSLIAGCGDDEYGGDITITCVEVRGDKVTLEIGRWQWACEIIDPAYKPSLTFLAALAKALADDENADYIGMLDAEQREVFREFLHDHQEQLAGALLMLQAGRTT